MPRPRRRPPGCAVSGRREEPGHGRAANLDAHQRQVITTLRDEIGLQTVVVNVTVDDVLDGEDQ